METEMIEATLNEDIFDQLLPSYGNRRIKLPIWNEEQRMYICDEYESATGNYYYKGIRFSNRIVFVEKIGLYHSCTYIDGLEVYAFNGEKLDLVQKKEYVKEFRDDDFIRKESKKMVYNYLKGSLIQSGKAVPDSVIETKAGKVVEESYKSLLDDDYNNMYLSKVVLQIK